MNISDSCVIVTDTVKTAIENKSNIYFYCNTQSESWFTTISMGEVMTIVVAIAGIILAIYQYKKTQKENWFLYVIVLPQLDHINNSYKEIIQNTETDKAKDLPYETYVNVAEIKTQRKKEINESFDQLTTLVFSYNQQLGESVQNVIMELEDIYVEIIDAYCNSEDVKARNLILFNKQKLISTLNRGLSVD